MSHSRHRNKFSTPSFRARPCQYKSNHVLWSSQLNQKRGTVNRPRASCSVRPPSQSHAASTSLSPMQYYWQGLQPQRSPIYSLPPSCAANGARLEECKVSGEKNEMSNVTRVNYAVTSMTDHT